jgi:hypothetical protein
MENDIWAVYDFMALLKALQVRMTCISIPWVPPTNMQNCYLLNTMVLGEESDDLGTGVATNATSHFEFYLKAMEEVGADSSSVKSFIA